MCGAFVSACLHRCSFRLWARRQLNRGGRQQSNGTERPIAGVTAFDRVVDEATVKPEKKSRLEDVRSKIGGRSRKGNGSESGTGYVVWVVVLGGSKAHAFNDQRD